MRTNGRPEWQTKMWTNDATNASWGRIRTEKKNIRSLLEKQNKRRRRKRLQRQHRRQKKREKRQLANWTIEHIGGTHSSHSPSLAVCRIAVKLRMFGSWTSQSIASKLLYSCLISFDRNHMRMPWPWHTMDERASSIEHRNRVCWSTYNGHSKTASGREPLDTHDIMLKLWLTGSYCSHTPHTAAVQFTCTSWHDTKKREIQIECADYNETTHRWAWASVEKNLSNTMPRQTKPTFG